MKNVIIKEIPITKKSKIVISTVVLNGKKKLDVRLWIYYLNKKTGLEDFYPGLKGINIPIEKCKEITAGLELIKIKKGK